MEGLDGFLWRGTFGKSRFKRARDIVGSIRGPTHVGSVESRCAG